VIAEREHYTACIYGTTAQNQNLTADDTDHADLHGSKNFQQDLLICESVLSVFIHGEIVVYAKQAALAWIAALSAPH
jgi:hypothetical protein